MSHLLAAFSVPNVLGIGAFCRFCPEECGGRSFPQGLLGTFLHIGADTSVHRYLWNQINKSINLGHGFKKTNSLILRCR